MLRLRVLGGLTLEANGQPLELAAHRKSLVVLAAVAVAANGGISRDKLLALFWPDSDETRARNALRQRLHSLRKALGIDVVTGAAQLSLNPSVISADILDFDAALRSGDAAAAAELYDGPLLDGIYIKEAAVFERWVEERRAQIATRLKAALRKAASVAAARGDHAVAVKDWRRLVEFDPVDGDVAAGLALALVTMGDQASALRSLRDHEARVRLDLGVDADRRVLNLLAELERPRQLSPLPSRVSPSSTTPIAETPTMRDEATTRRTPQSPSFWRSNGNRIKAAGAGLAVLALLTVALRPRDNAPPVVVVAPFHNISGDTALDRIAQLVTIWVHDEVAGDASWSTVDATAVLGERAPRNDVNGSRLALDSLERLLDRSRATLLVAGRFFRRNDSLEFRVSVAEAKSGRILSTLPAVIGAAADPSAALEEVSTRVRGALATLVDDRITVVRDAAAPAPRFAAYEAYARGLDAFMTPRPWLYDFKEAIKHFSDATRLDSTFNLPLVWTAFAFWSQNDPRGLDSVITLLDARRDRLGGLDRMALDYWVAWKRGEREQGCAIAQRAARLAPLSQWTYTKGSCLADAGRYAEAVTVFRQMDDERAWLRGRHSYWQGYYDALHFAGEHRLELSEARRALAQYRQGWNIRYLLYALATNGKIEELKRLVDSAAVALPENQLTLLNGWLNGTAGEAATHAGREAGRAVAQLCVDWHRTHKPNGARPLDSLEATGYLQTYSECLFRLERFDEARELARQAEAFSNPPGDYGAIMLAHIAARSGDSAAIAAQLTKTYARPNFASGKVLNPVLGARLATAAGDARALAENLRKFDRPLGARHFVHKAPGMTAALRSARSVRQVIATP